MGTSQQLRQWTCDGRTEQQWIPIGYGGGRWVFESWPFRGYCMDVYGASYADTAGVFLWSCHHGSNQQWA
jgi:hypothetical protein